MVSCFRNRTARREIGQCKFMLIITTDYANSALLNTSDNVNTFCACVYLQSLALLQQWPTRYIQVDQYL